MSDVVEIGGRGKDTRVHVKRESVQQGFTIVTIGGIIVLFLVVGIIIWFSVSQTALPPPPQGSTLKQQVNMNPLIITQSQCLTIPTAIWTDEGCECSNPYQGDFCRAQLVTSFSGVTGTLTSGIIEETFDDLLECNQRCQRDPSCRGFSMDGRCQRFFGEIRVENIEGHDKILYLRP